MKMRKRRSRFPRFDWRRSIDSSEPLKGQLWTRSEKALKEPDVHWARRVAAGTAAVLEGALLAWLLLGPALGIRDVEVNGAKHLTTAQVLQAAGLDQASSILSVDGQAAQQRLLAQTWIRAASCSCCRTRP
jgi:cell division septal protein FtsQ